MAWLVPDPASDLPVHRRSSEELWADWMRACRMESQPGRCLTQDPGRPPQWQAVPDAAADVF